MRSFKLARNMSISVLALEIDVFFSSGVVNNVGS